MKKTFAALVTLLVLGGCSHGTLDARLAKVQTDPIVARHDAYVTNDATLDEATKAKYLATSAGWLDSINKAVEPDEVTE